MKKQVKKSNNPKVNPVRELAQGVRSRVRVKEMSSVANRGAFSNGVKFKPAGDRVLVKPDEAEDERTASGIIIPDSARKEKPERGVVVAVGEGKRTEKGDIVPMRCKVGDKVMFSKYGYDEVTIGEEEYYVISESNILGTF